jgi:cephalosporin hydroxylase
LIALSRDQLDEVLIRATENWAHVRWRGHPLWQNLFDLNVISEHIFAEQPDVIVETGTWYGGSAVFYADIMTLAGLPPDVVSIDCAPRATPAHPGVRYVAGRSSTNPEVVRDVARLVDGRRAFVVLDSDHVADHVFEELVSYSPLIHPRDYLLVQDGNMCTTMGLMLGQTPIGGIVRFLEQSNQFEVDDNRSPFPTTGHVHGWLRRVG